MNDTRYAIPLTELEIVETLLTHLRNDAGDIVWAREARSHGRSRADVVLLWDAEVVAIEVKRTDWKRAVLQAVLNRYCADRSFIALWVSRVSDDVLEEASRRGLGVISVAPDSVRVVQEAPIGRPDPRIRSRLLDQLTAPGRS
jgi:hypothetical protein